MARNFNIFISHSWSYSEDLRSLQRLLNERGYFNVTFSEASRDVPINSNNATYIKSVLRTKILNSNIVLALAGMYANYSEWMTWELDTAKQHQIPIVGVIPRGQERISTTVSSRSTYDVRWNTESIVAAIRSFAR